MISRKKKAAYEKKRNSQFTVHK